MQAEATLKRAIIESIVTFSKKTDAILHSAIMVNIALADKQRILSSGILNTFLVLIYRTLCFNSFHSCLSLNQPRIGQNKRELPDRINIILEYC